MSRSTSKRVSLPAVILTVAALAVAGCAQKPKQNALASAGKAVPGSAEDFTVNVGDRVLFEVDSASLTSTAQGTLDRQAQWLNLYPKYNVTISGHADERGTREYNLALGARRAAATRSYLASRGVSAERIQTISFGKERPVSVCDAESCWSQNRRAVTGLNQAGS